MIVLACKLDLHFPETHSLKEKRQLLKKITSRVRNEYSVSIAEVGCHELWQRAELGFAFVGSDPSKLHALKNQVINSIEGLHVAEILDQQAHTWRP